MNKLNRFGKRKGYQMTGQPKIIVRLGDMPQMGRVTVPTVAVMPMREAKALGVPVTHIEGHGHMELRKAIVKAVAKARKMSPAGMVSVTGTGPYAAARNVKELMAVVEASAKMFHGKGRIVPVKGRLTPGKGLRGHYSLQQVKGLGLDVGIENDPDGTPVIVIFSPTPEIPTYRVKHVVRRDEDDDDEDDDKHDGGGDGGGTPPDDGHTLLKAPWTDDLLTMAMTKAADAMLDSDQKGHMKWKEDDEYHVKEFGNIQLLVCLFFYVYIHKIFADSDFFYGQRKPFYNYCRRHLPEDFDIGGDRNFRGCINKLQNRQTSFDQYILADEKPTVAWEKGKTNMVFWYEVYRQAAKTFSDVFDAEAET